MSAFRRKTVVGFVWHLVDERASRVLDDWRDLLAHSRVDQPVPEHTLTKRGRVVKANRVRRVFHVYGDGEVPGVYGKHMLGARGLRSHWERMRTSLGASRACREAQALLRLSRLDLPVPRVIAWGDAVEPSRGDESWLLIEEAPGAVDLIPHLAFEFPLKLKGEAFRRKRALLDRIAALAARMHDLGVVHDDFHLGNLLIRPDSGELVLLDLGKTHQATRLSLNQRLFNLALLVHSFRYRFTVTDAIFLLKRYLAHATIACQPRVALGILAGRVQRMHRQRLSRRVMKAFAESGSFRLVDNSEMRGVMHRDFDLDRVLDFCGGSLAPVECRGWERHLFAGDCRSRTGKNLRRHPAAHEWAQCVLLFLQGESSRRPVAFLCQKQGRGLGRALIIDAPWDEDHPERRPPPSL